MNAPLRQIAVIADELDLVRVLRARAELLQVSRATIDQLCGWKSGQAAKYLSDPPVRGLSLESLITLSAGLGAALVLVEHDQSMVYIAKRTRKREQKAVRAYGQASMFNRRAARRIIQHFGAIGGAERALQLESSARCKIAAKGGRARRRALDRAARKAIASQAATTRWERVRAAVQIRKWGRCGFSDTPSSYAHGNPPSALARPDQTTSKPRRPVLRRNRQAQAQASPRPSPQPADQQGCTTGHRNAGICRQADKQRE